MNRTFVYRLTISMWPEAVKAGLTPMEYPTWFFPRDAANPAAYYHPFSFAFENAPSREDFLEVHKTLPWLSAYDWWLPIIAANQWPLIGPGYKSANCDMLNAANQIIGKIDVARYDMWENMYHLVPHIPSDALLNAVRQLDPSKRDEAKAFLRSKYHAIRERAMQYVGDEDDCVKYVVNCMMHEAGYRKSPPRKPASVSLLGTPDLVS